MSQAVTFANTDVAQIVWCYQQKIPRCLGFAIWPRVIGSCCRLGWDSRPGQSSVDGEHHRGLAGAEIRLGRSHDR